MKDGYTGAGSYFTMVWTADKLSMLYSTRTAAIGKAYLLRYLLCQLNKIKKKKEKKKFSFAQEQRTVCL